MIEATTIATNKYAPNGSEAISLYTNGEASGLTIGQLVISVCMRSASAYEAESVIKMNYLTAGAVKLDEGSQWMEKIANGSADWTAAKAYLTGTLGIKDSALPENINTYDRRMTAITAVKQKIDELAQQQQRDMIDLQTLVNRRDVAFSTSSNTVKALGNSQIANAANF